jgi:acetyl esterase/lipase
MRLLFLLSFLSTVCSLNAQEAIKLYPGKAPGSESWNWEEAESTPYPGINLRYNVTEPVLLYYPADKAKANGTSMIIAPGGGFRFLSINYEGTDVAKWLNQLGVSAFVLKYRVVRSFTNDPLAEIAPLIKDNKKFDSLNAPVVELAKNDGIAAMKYVRLNAAKYGIDPKRIGFMGFSAGGTVTMSVVLSAPQEWKPNFIAPVYLYATSVLGNDMPKSSMPAFLAVAADDGLALDAHSIELYQKWKLAKQPVELHVYENGEHGFGMRKQGKSSDNWTNDFEHWLRIRKLIK